MTNRRLGEATTAELSNDLPSIVLVPLGSCEQHGPHLPVDTDTRIAQAICERALADRSDLWVTPPISFGASGEHRGFAGTLSIGTDALVTVLVELVRSAIPPHDQVIIVNGHGGNAQALAQLSAISAQEGRNCLVWSPRVDGGDLHAGRTETSLMLAIAPELVRSDAAEAGCTDPPAAIAQQLRTAGVRSVSPNGVLGDPSGASPDEGAQLLSHLARDLLQAIDRAALTNQ